MFHVNETLNGLGTLKVQDGNLTLHVTLQGKSIMNLYEGKAEDAVNHKDMWLNPTLDTVVYPEGKSVVHGFDIPVELLDKDFDLSLIGKKGIWYDHKVKVSFPEGDYNMEASLEGGTGKTTLNSCSLNVKEGKYQLTLGLSSSKYDFVEVDSKRYNTTIKGSSSYVSFPIDALSHSFNIKANTNAMSVPHLIEYSVNIKGILQ